MPVDLPTIAYTACPGKGLNSLDLAQAVFGSPPVNGLIGNYRSLWVGHARQPEIRSRAASGGVITQTLAYLLQEGRIEGAVVLCHGEPEPWLSRPRIATTVQQILDSAQSVYVPVPVNEILGEMAEFEGRLAYVGLPDQVASLRELQRLGHPGARKVNYVLGPYVGTMIYLEGLKSFLSSQGVSDLRQVQSVRYRAGEWPGYLEVLTIGGRTIRARKFYYNYLIPFYVTRSTLYSVDFANELTDLSVGDAWSPELETRGGGHSVVVVRSAAAEALVQAMRANGLLELEPISADRALAMHAHMIDFKKRGAHIRIGWRRWLGKPVPEYGLRPVSIPARRVLVEVIISTIFAVGQTRIARAAAKLIPLSILGPLFHWLRATWKRASKPSKRKGLIELAFERTNPQP